MKICIVVDDYMPFSIKIGAKMMHELAIELVGRGHEVMVVTVGINLKKPYEKDILDRVSIYRFSSGEIKNISKVKRVINEYLLSYRAWKNLKDIFYQSQIELIIYYSPTIFLGSLIKKLKKLWNAKSYLILRDLFPQWVIDNGMLSKNSPITKFFQYFERINYDQADRIGIQPQKNIDWFKQYFSKKKQIDLLYNWATDTPIQLTEKKLRKRLNLEGKIVLFYGGNIGHAQDISQILRLAKSLSSHPGAHIVLMGAGDEVNLVKQFIKNESPGN